MPLVSPDEAVKERVLAVQEYSVLAGQAVANLFRRPLYVADMLMQVALQFEATHFAQIRRHYQSFRPEPDDNPGQQLDLFEEHRTF